MMMNSKMIPANLKPEILIKEDDKYAIHVDLVRKVLRPGALDSETSHNIKCFPIRTFENLEALRTAKNPQIWYRNGGFVECTVIHDGRLVGKEVEQKTELTDEVKERIATEVKKATRGKSKKTFLT